MKKKLKILIYNIYKVLKYAFGLSNQYSKNVEKSRLTKTLDLFRLNFRESQMLSMYYVIGLNEKGTDISDYIGRKELYKIKNYVEKKLTKDANLNYDVVAKDKFYATSIFEANNIACVPNIALISNSKIFYINGKAYDLKKQFKKFMFPIIVKNTILEYNEGFYKCEFKNNTFKVNGKTVNYNEFINRLKFGKWVIQELYKPHEEIRIINHTALNTTRIVTILNGRDPLYLAGFQAFATGEQITDSWEKGSVYVGIDPEYNSLKKYGYFHPCVNSLGRIEKHPESGVKFEGYKISELNSAVNLCLHAHRLLYFSFLIGWDVAITDAGPLILEANEKPGMNAVQCIDGGLRRKIRTNFLNTLNYLKNQI